jgi:hypothetical protein
MSDFSDLCPLFNTGVYGEVTLPYLVLASISSTSEAGGYIFGRSVIVTAAYNIKHTTIASTTDSFTILLDHGTSYGAATKTTFASHVVSKTVIVQAIGEPVAMTVTAKTFGATDALTVTTDGAESGAKHHSIIVRFKEK